MFRRTETSDGNQYFPMYISTSLLLIHSIPGTWYTYCSLTALHVVVVAYISRFNMNAVQRRQQLQAVPSLRSSAALVVSGVSCGKFTIDGIVRSIVRRELDSKSYGGVSLPDTDGAIVVRARGHLVMLFFRLPPPPPSVGHGRRGLWRYQCVEVFSSYDSYGVRDPNSWAIRLLYNAQTAASVAASYRRLHLTSRRPPQPAPNQCSSSRLVASVERGTN